MIPVSLGQIAGAIGAACDTRDRSLWIRGISTDSRTVAPGDLFVAIAGKRLDGHRFLHQALAGGAAACLCDSDFRAKERVRGASHTGPCLSVTNTVEALGRLAAWYRRDVMEDDTTVVAVTGSNGKTTTKGMIDHVLSASMPGHAAIKSYNNHIGVPLTLLSGDRKDRYLIVEIGSNAPGEVASLAAMTQPNIAVITSIAQAHLRGLGSLAGVAAEKGSILKHLRPGGLAVVNVDREEINAVLHHVHPESLVTFGFGKRSNVAVTRVTGTLERTVVELGDGTRLELAMPGQHHATNAAAAFVVCRRFGLSPETIAQRLGSFEPKTGRTHVIRLNGVIVVDDTYNANPESVRSAVKALCTLAKGRRVLVLGDMHELGDRSAPLHREVVQFAIDSGVEVLIAVGPMMIEASQVFAPQSHGRGERVFARDADVAADLVPRLLRQGDTIWLKGSWAMGLDRVVERLRHGFGLHSDAVAARAMTSVQAVE